MYTSMIPKHTNCPGVTEERERGKMEKRSLKEKLAEGKVTSIKQLPERKESQNKKKEELMR